MAEEKQYVEVIEEENAPSKWSFLKYVKSIGHYKWWVIGFSLFGALAGYLGFRFVLNPMRKTLTATYNYDLAGTYTDSDTIRFIDGSLFNPYDLTAKENLLLVKNSDEKYAKVDVDKIVLNNSITISKNVEYANENDPSSMYVNYTISAKAKTFPSDELGKEFLFDLINLAKGLSTTAINNYQTPSNFTDNFSTLTFDRQISQLEEQYKSIEKLYKDLGTEFGESAVGGADGTKLYEYLNDYVSNYFMSGVSNFTDVLTGQKDSNKFVNYVVGKEEEKISEIHALCASYKEAIKNNTRDIEIYEDRLDKLLSSASIIGTDTNVSAQITAYNQTIVELRKNNSDIAKELNNNGYFLNLLGEYEFDPLNTNTTIYKLTAKEDAWVKANGDFAASIAAYKGSLDEDRNGNTAVYRYCYAQYQNKINVQNGGYINLTGAINNLIGAAAGLVVAFAVTSLITAAIYINKEPDKKAEEKKD